MDEEVEHSLTKGRVMVPTIKLVDDPGPEVRQAFSRLY